MTMPKLDLDAVRKLIRTEEDAAVLQEKLKAMIEEAHPAAPIFRAGETMPMHEFERRFKRHCCGNIEPRFCGTIVRIIGQGPHGLSVELETIGGGGGVKGD